MINKEQQIRSPLIHSQEELTRYGLLKDETLRAQAAEKIWMAFHKLLELTVSQTIKTGELWKEVHSINDTELNRITMAAGPPHNHHYTWEEYGPSMEDDFAYSHAAIKKPLAQC